MPPLLGGRVTVRVRIRVPPPHIRLHSLHSPQGLTSQSTGMGQGSLLQARVSMSSGQAIPPLPGCRVTVRVRVCVPPPHIRLHSPHSPQGLTSQSTGMGQGSLLQARVSMSSGQAIPPLPGCWRTVRLRV